MSLQQVNLLNPQLLTPHVAFSSKTIAWMLLGVVGLGLALYGLVESSTGKVRTQLEQAQGMRDELQAKVDALSQPTADGLTPGDKRAQAVVQEKQRIAQLQRLRDALGAARDTPGFSSRLRALANEGLPGVWLTDIEFNLDGFRLEGRALQPARIPDYLGVLSRQPALRDLPLSGFSILPPAAAESGKPALPGVAFAVNPAAGAQ